MTTSPLDEAFRRGLDGPETVVDLSNVLRAAELDPPHEKGPAPRPADLARLTRLTDAWRVKRDASPAFVGVADASLLKLCVPDERRWLQSWAARGAIEIVPYADPVVLDRAETLDLVVLSRDMFRGFRRENAWVAGHPDRFVSWTVHQGVVTFEPGLRPVPPQDISRAEEDDRFRAVSRIGEERLRVTGDRWRCTTEGCFAHIRYPSRLPILPVIRDGVATCPLCSRPLESLGPVTRFAGLKAEYEGAVTAEFVLEAGDEVEIGRGPEQGFPVATGLDPTAAELVSRRHLAARVVGDRVEVRDLDSLNGTELMRWDPAGGRLAAVRRLEPMNWVGLGRRDGVRLGGRVVVRRSGRRWPNESEPVPWDTADVTRLS